ncbi:hypothetical protein L208DRAFT_1550692 [Tricholoma matsutake]|nr:hypothetical protein L208DRAFT_1550692 [Tricholoma matsutake 945]
MEVLVLLPVVAFPQATIFWWTRNQATQSCDCLATLSVYHAAITAPSTHPTIQRSSMTSMRCLMSATPH